MNIAVICENALSSQTNISNLWDTGAFFSSRKWVASTQHHIGRQVTKEIGMQMERFGASVFPSPIYCLIYSFYLSTKGF